MKELVISRRLIIYEKSKLKNEQDSSQFGCLLCFCTAERWIATFYLILTVDYKTSKE